jgi:hypothetical protein
MTEIHPLNCRVVTQCNSCVELIFECAKVFDKDLSNFFKLPKVSDKPVQLRELHIIVKASLI